MVRQALILLAVLAVGTGLGYWLSPTKIVEKEKIVTEVQKNVVTKTVHVKGKDGTNTTTIITIDKSELHSETNKSKVTTKENKDWMVTGGIVGIDKQVPFIFVQRRILGEIYAGVGCDRDLQATVGITFRF